MIDSSEISANEAATRINPVGGQRQWKKIGINTTYFALCTVLTLMFLFPIVWSILTSFETAADAMASPPLSCPLPTDKLEPCPIPWR